VALHNVLFRRHFYRCVISECINIITIERKMVTKEIDIKQTQIKSSSHHGDTLTGKQLKTSMRRRDANPTYFL